MGHSGGVNAPDGLGRYLEALAVCLESPESDGEDVARRAYLSRYHFDRLVSRALDEPPAALRRRVLLERSAYALRHSSLAVIDVATQAGYASREGFTRAFTQAYGVSPSQWRSAHTAQYELSAPNGVHFHPPAGLSIRNDRELNEMDTMQQLMRFHVELVGQVVARLADVPEAELDRALDMDVEWCDAQPFSLRALVDGLVTQEERYAFAVQGRERPDGGTDVALLAARHAVAGPALVEFVDSVVGRRRLGDTFVMAECDPPRETTFGGAILHVLTFGAVRRTMALRALAAATGDESLGWGDPIGLFDVA